MSIIKWVANLFKPQDDKKSANIVELQNGRKARVDELGNFIGWDK